MANSLLRTEWLKLRKYKAFWAMAGVIALSYPGINYILYDTYNEQLKGEMGSLLSMLANPFTFPEVWHTVAYLSSCFVFIPSLVVIMFITNEYTYKTHRQNVIDGWSRDQFMLAKMIDVALVALLITVLYFFVALVIGYLNYGKSTGNLWGEAQNIPLFFLQSFSQLSIAFLMAFLIRKAFIALGAFMFYFVIVENFIVNYGREKWNDIGRFMPMEISDRLIPRPRFTVRDPKRWQEMVDAINVHLIYTILLVALTWFICFRINKKRDF